jgi:hypothetical protein
MVAPEHPGSGDISAVPARQRKLKRMLFAGSTNVKPEKY